MGLDIGNPISMIYHSDNVKEQKHRVLQSMLRKASVDMQPQGMIRHITTSNYISQLLILVKGTDKKILHLLAHVQIHLFHT